jgi:hypothetical protein
VFESLVSINGQTHQTHHNASMSKNDSDVGPNRTRKTRKWFYDGKRHVEHGLKAQGNAPESLENDYKILETETKNSSGQARASGKRATSREVAFDLDLGIK